MDYMEVSVDYNSLQSAIHRARTPRDRSLLLHADIVTARRIGGKRTGRGTARSGADRLGTC